MSTHRRFLLAALVLAVAALLGHLDRATPSAVLAQPVPTAMPTAGPATWTVVGTLGAFVQVADGCSHYPLTKCDNSVLDVSESSLGMLSGYVGQAVRLTLVNAECGRGIAGQALFGPVAMRVATTLPCSGSGPVLCDAIQSRVPAAVIQAALANPETVMGWGERCNPSVPSGPFNGRRDHLSILNFGAPFHPTYNPVVYKCGCP